VKEKDLTQEEKEVSLGSERSEAQRISPDR
jgi:hypothetical protein